MEAGLVVVVAFAAYLVWAITRAAEPVPSHMTAAVRTPQSEAERILAARYAHGDISAPEYQRMLAILRN